MMATTPTGLTLFEEELITLGITAATAFSLPKSVGAMFGMAFASAVPLTLDDFVERLEISKGSASNGLKFLQRLGAVKPVYLPTDRRTHYEPEISLRRLVIGVLNENVVPHLQQSGDRVDRLKAHLKELPQSEQKILSERVEALESWGRKGRLLMPLVERFLSAPLKKKAKAGSVVGSP